MRARGESFGAWVQLDERTLIAVDRRRARALGVDGGALWTDAPAPPPFAIEAHVAVTARCSLECVSCYQDATADGAHRAMHEIDATLDALAARGVFTVAFGGGEPLALPWLGAAARAVRERGMSAVVTTSGAGLRAEHIEDLRAFSQVNVSHDGTGGAYRSLRGFEGASLAERAITLLRANDIAVGANVVLARETFAHVEATAERLAAMGVCELQLLRFKPAGRAASLDYLARRLTGEQALAVGALVERLSLAHGARMAVRVDCAMVPFLVSYGARGEALAQWGVFGCEAARHLMAVDTRGAVRGCSFDRAGEPSAMDTWEHAEALHAFRAFASDPPEPCASCEARSVCRGGCKVVARFIDGTGRGPFTADPECPRVIAHREATR